MPKPLDCFTGGEARLSEDAIYRLFQASRRVDEPVAALVALAVLNPWSIDQLAASTIEGLDQVDGTVLLGSGSCFGEVAIGFEAACVLTTAMPSIAKVRSTMRGR